MNNYPKIWKDLVSEEITHLVGDVNYTHIFYKSGRKAVSAFTLKVWETERLPGFLRIHKQTIVNPEHVTEWLLERHEIRIGKNRFQVSRRRCREIKKMPLKMKNKTLIEAGRQILRSLLHQCTDGERGMFLRMYAPKAQSIEDGISQIDTEKIDWAISQVERTIEKRKSNQ